MRGVQSGLRRVLGYLRGAVRRARSLIASSTRAIAGVASGVSILCATSSVVALGPLVVGGRLSSPVHLGLALPLVLGAAAAWAVVLLLPASAIAAALPGFAAGPVATWRRTDVVPHGLRTIAGVLLLVALEVGLVAAASDFSRRHDATGALARGAAVAGPGLVLVFAVVFAARRWGVRRWLLRSALVLPAAVPAALFVTLPDHLRANSEITWSLWVVASLPYAAALSIRQRWHAAVAAVLAGVACFVALAFAFGARPGLAALLYHDHAPTRWVVAAGRAATDFDGDGSSAVFGGRDCAPFDARRGPQADEIAGNGIDENCLLGDLADDRPRTIPAIGSELPAGHVRANVLVLSVDALRPDRMSIHGYSRPTTPRIAEHFADAIRFERAYAEAASTRDTLASLLTGRSIAELRWYRRKAVVLDPRTRTIAHRLGEQGYRTIAVLPFVALNMMGATDLGFDTTEVYDDKATDCAAQVNARLLAALRGRAGPFFAFAHYYEPHEPYRRHPRHRRVSADPYDQEIAAVDEAIGELLRALREDGKLNDTIVVLTSDHGEAFGEHGHRFHNQGVYEEDLRVPWLIRIPGRGGAEVHAPVSTTALVATLHDALSLALPVDGGPSVPSVLPLLDPGATAPPVFATARAGLDRERMALVTDDVKILFDRELSAFEVYDLARDRGELDDLSSSVPALVDGQLKAAAEVLEHVVGAAASRQRRALSHSRVPAHALQAPPGAPAGLTVRGAWAELSRGIDGSGLPPRVLVHTFIDNGFDGVLEVALYDGSARAQHVTGPIAAGSDGAPIVEEVRTFKVYVEDAAQTVELAIGQWRWSLGAVADLPVAGPGAPPLYSAPP